MLSTWKATCTALTFFLACTDQHARQNPLPPPPHLPAYESDLNHAALISDMDQEFYHAGLEGYRTACFSCHGNVEHKGTLPGSRQFWTEPFENGSDPFALYRTLTLGYEGMPPQHHLTPREKYAIIHFVREEFLRKNNPTQYTPITRRYLASLPQGNTIGPAPDRERPWVTMDYGRFLIRTYEVASNNTTPKGISRGASPLPNEDFSDRNFAFKGIAIRLDPGSGGVAKGQAFVLFDHDLMRLAAFWTGEGFIDYEDILLDDQHNVFPRIVGDLQFQNPPGPGWADPISGRFDDPRFRAVDGRRFGPLKRTWAHYKGLYNHEGRVIVHYTVAGSRVLETYDLDAPNILSRTLNVDAASVERKMRIAPDNVQVAATGAEVQKEDGFHVLIIPPGAKSRIRLQLTRNNQSFDDTPPQPADLTAYTSGGDVHYPTRLTAPIIRGEDGPFAVDVFALPRDNPWASRMRPTGIDFLNNGAAAAVSTIDGEVWRLDNILDGPVEWRRIAAGLFQPLGVKVHNGDIYVGCRDQIVRLVDLNNDGETDYYESFNSDHMVTEHFHEFAMGLQTDEEGRFYYAKSARHARTALVPHHGTLIRVAADGSSSDVIATGFRAANGVLLNPDGSFFVTDQEGHWNPMNRINRVMEGGFYGNMFSYGAPSDSSDAAMELPLAWLDQSTDRSPAELVRVEGGRWGPLNGSLLSLSYGYGKIFVVLPQSFDNTWQGAVAELPLPQFPTGIMRGRFNPADGQLYALGMSAWATSQMIQTGGLYRVQYTGEPLPIPVAMRSLRGQIELRFGTPLMAAAATEPARYSITTWDLMRTRNYGSERYNTTELHIAGATLSEDGTVVRLDVPNLAPTWIVEIAYQLETLDGIPASGKVQGTIHALE